MPAARPLAVTALAALALGVTAAAAAPGGVTRVSLPDSGPASNTPSKLAAVSADGSRVAFTTTAPLTGTPTGGKVQVFVRDLATGHTILASADSAGVPSPVDVEAGDNINPFFDISGNGRYVVWGTATAVFRKDLDTGASLKLDDTAVPPDPTSSYDGNRVAYRTSLPHIVMRDVAAGTTTPVSVNSQGGDPLGTNGVEDPAISADGRIVVFEAVQDGHGLVPNEAAPNINDIIVRNIAAGTTTAASVDSAGTAIGGNRPDISGDGRYVVFQLGGQIFRRDMQAGTTVLVSAKDGDVTPGNLASAGTQISADGSRVSFASNASDLIGALDTNNSSDVFVRDVATKATRRVSTTALGAEAPTGADSGAIGGNGARVAFTSLDPLVLPDANAATDVFATEQAPTDTAGPAVTLSGPADGAAVDGGQVQVTGTASDPSGVGALTVAGQPIAVGAGGAFAATVPLGAPGQPVAIDVVAVDGAGNRSALTRTVTRAVPPAPPGGVAGVPVAAGAVRPVSVAKTAAKRPAVRGLSVSVVRGTLRVRFTLAVRSAVKVELLRSRRVHKRTRLVRIAVVRKTLAAGPRTLTLHVPKAGAVRVRVTATAAGRSVVALKSLVVRRR